METDRDPTDVGLPWIPDDDGDPVTLDGLRANDLEPEVPEPRKSPASEESRAESLAVVAERTGRPSNAGRLAVACGTCHAGPRQWCRGRLGFVHPSR